MAVPGPSGPHARPDVGDILLVIRKSAVRPSLVLFSAWRRGASPAALRCQADGEKSRRDPTAPCSSGTVANAAARADDFQARSSDELSLAKGDRVELIERDDEFGDGWFLGRHLVNGNSGLFPEGWFVLAQALVSAD